MSPSRQTYVVWSMSVWAADTPAGQSAAPPLQWPHWSPVCVSAETTPRSTTTHLHAHRHTQTAHEIRSPRGSSTMWILPTHNAAHTVCQQQYDAGDGGPQQQASCEPQQQDEDQADSQGQQQTSATDTQVHSNHSLTAQSPNQLGDCIDKCAKLRFFTKNHSKALL